jgi:TolA-binding protein
MASELTTRDVFQQLDARLTRVEDDVRRLRTEMNQRFQQMNQRFDEMSQRFDRLTAMFVSLVIGLGVGLIGIWFKL